MVLLSFVTYILVSGLSLAMASAGNPEDSDNYIVLFHDHLSSAIQKRDTHHEWVKRMIDVEKDTGSKVEGHLQVGKKLSGYHGKFTNAQIEKIKRSPEVAIVERDSDEIIQAVAFLQQDETPWGLSRISHKENTYLENKPSEYKFQPGNNNNTVVYVLDTGVRMEHKEFKDRIRWGVNLANDKDEDENGHGTHVAGVSAGHSVGVAKDAHIVSVKILDANQRGSLSNFIKGVHWIIDDHQKNPDQRSVINYSAVGEISDSRNKAIDEAVDAGILFVGAAGNKGDDACKYGPPSNNRDKTGQMVVAALNYTDRPADFSNYGECVDVYAPGVDIRSSVKDGPDSYGTMSGSSMASPHVAGLAAYYWSQNHDYSLEDVVDRIVNSNQGKIRDPRPNSPNKIAYNGAS